MNCYKYIFYIQETTANQSIAIKIYFLLSLPDFRVHSKGDGEQHNYSVANASPLRKVPRRHNEEFRQHRETQNSLLPEESVLSQQDGPYVCGLEIREAVRFPGRTLLLHGHDEAACGAGRGHDALLRVQQQLGGRRHD